MAGLSLFKRESKPSSKIDLFPKWFINDLSNKVFTKRLCFIKSWSHLVSKGVILKMLWKPHFALQRFCPSKEEWFQTDFKTSIKTFWFKLTSENVLFYQTKGFTKYIGFQNLHHGTNLNNRYNLMVTSSLFNRVRGKVTVSGISSDVARGGLRTIYWDMWV